MSHFAGEALVAYRKRQKKVKFDLRERRKAQGLCPECGDPRASTLRCKTCSEKRNQALLRYRLKLRAEVFQAYGGAKCACEKCPEHENPHIQLLTVNHVGGGGTRHRVSIGGHRIPGGGITFGGYHTYAWLRKHGFPPGYNILCWNCQWGVHTNHGICPHMESQ